MKDQAIECLNRISNTYDRIKEPKYRNANLADLKEDLNTLYEMKEYLNDLKKYHDLINGISQVVHHIELNTNDEQSWMNVTGRDINKAIQPIMNKTGHPIVFPFEWSDPKSGEPCRINDGSWDARNFMVMDVLGYIFLLKEGGDCLPSNTYSVFNNIQDIETRESLLFKESSELMKTLDIFDPQKILKSKYWIKFTDSIFKKFTLSKYNSNQIRDLLHQTSRVEFKLVFPVRIMEEKKAKENLYPMNMFSRLFEFGYIDKDVRKDRIVQGREYYISFNTILGELFIHNLLMKNYDFIDASLYNLPQNAQLFYRQFIIHHNYHSLAINLDTIKERLHLYDKNITNLTRTIESNILTPLIQQGFIESFEKINNGLMGIKYQIRCPKKGKISNGNKQ